MDYSSAKKLPHRRCYCDWPQCESFFNSIKSGALSNHPWNAKTIRVQFKQRLPSELTSKAFTFLKSVHKHLRSNEVILVVPSSISIHPHHFPTALLEWKSQNPKIGIVTPLTLTQARLISEHDKGNRRFIEYTNSMKYLHNHQLHQSYMITPHSPTTDDLYIQSPFSTLQDIVSFVSSINRRQIFKPTLPIVSLPIPSTPETTPSDLTCYEESVTEHINDEDSIDSTYDNDTQSINHHAVPSTLVHISPSTISFVPSIQQLHYMLRTKFAELNRDYDTFKRNSIVKQIAKLLHRYYEDDSTVSLSNVSQSPMIYYICNKSKLTPYHDSCEFFNLKTRLLDNVLCASCYQATAYDLRRKKRLVTSPSRKRPFTSMSPQNQFRRI